MLEKIAGLALPALIAIFWILVILRIVINKHVPTKIVKATVTDKQIIETFSKYAGNGKQEKYVVVFSVDGKKKSFYVSQFSYGGYRLKEKGTLKYKGDKLISFD